MIDLIIPNNEILICIGLVAITFLLGRFKLGLLIAYCFAFYWGFFENKDLFFVSLERSTPYVLLYFVSGFALVVFTLLSFLSSE
jgi:hypothetical protein